MTSLIRSTGPSEPIVRWVLEREARVITCQLSASGNQSYELCVLPHGEPAAAVIEQFAGPMPALLRHAEIAGRLREDGWVVIDHAAGMAPAAA